MAKLIAFFVGLACAALVVFAAPPPIAGAGTQGWVKATQSATGERIGAVLVPLSDRRFVLIGHAKGAPFVQAFDPLPGNWKEFTGAVPPINEFNPYYQTAYDPASKRIYCLSGGDVLYYLNLTDRTWNAFPKAPELAAMSWQTMACDPLTHKLVLIGADKTTANLGWMRTVIYDIPTGKWSRLEVADDAIIRAHRQLVAFNSAVDELVGLIRLVWYRDHDGHGTDVQIKELSDRCDAVKNLPGAAPFKAGLDGVEKLVEQGQALDALKAARVIERRVEESAESQYPVPCSRRNSPLAWDAKNKVFVLFGGDHEDYLMNDTWVLDLQKGAWKRMSPELAAGPRGGHAPFTLPKLGGVVLYEGYEQNSNPDYDSSPAIGLKPIEMWHYDPAGDRWDLMGAWGQPRGPKLPAPPPVGYFYGYMGQYFSAPAMAATSDDRIVLAAQPQSAPASTWTMASDGIKFDVDGRTRLGQPPNQRKYRQGEFLASFCDDPQEPKEADLDHLPENAWVQFPAPPRNPCTGCRQRDWGTAVWDGDDDQILLWGGGHRVRSASTVAHFSPASGRIVEGYDADEPYSGNGGGGFDSSILDRPWISVHNYCHYAYDPKCRLLVSARGYLYDPRRMDWIRMEQMAVPFDFQWGSTVVKGTPHGAVAWAKKKNSDDAGLWIFDKTHGWTDLEPAKGKLFVPYCDAHGMVYDSKRDRMLLSGVGAQYGKISDGTFLAYDFATHLLQTVAPQNPTLNQTHNARELAYVDHADWVVIGENYVQGQGPSAKVYTRIYDCLRNKMVLMDAGAVPDGSSTGWMYDAKRKLVYVMTNMGAVWALKINPMTAKLVDAP